MTRTIELEPLDFQFRLRGRYQLTTPMNAPLSANLFDTGVMLGVAFRF